MVALRVRRKSVVSENIVTLVSGVAWTAAVLTYTWAVWTQAQRSCRGAGSERKQGAIAPYSCDGCDPTRWQLWSRHEIDGKVEPIVRAGSVTGGHRGRRRKRRISDLEFHGRFIRDERLDQLVYEWFFRNDAGTAERQGRFVEVCEGAFGKGEGYGRDSLFFEATMGWGGVIVSGRGASLDSAMRGKDTRVIEENLCVDGRGNRTENSCVGLGDVLEAIGLGTVDVMMVAGGRGEGGGKRQLAVVKELEPEKILVRALAIELEEEDAEVREALLERGYCLVKRIERVELWVGDSVFRRLYCGWTAFRHEP